MRAVKNEARLNFRLPARSKRAIEEAAAELGQTVSDFAISTLVQMAEKVLQDRNVTRLSDRDREVFMAILDGKSAKPNKALVAAAKKYKKLRGG